MCEGARAFKDQFAATACIQCGSCENTKKTPDVNCRTSTIGDTTADAPLPVLGTTENAMPHSVQAMRPRTLAHAKVNHFIGSVGRCSL